MKQFHVVSVKGPMCHSDLTISISPFSIWIHPTHHSFFSSWCSSNCEHLVFLRELSRRLPCLKIGQKQCVMESGPDWTGTGSSVILSCWKYVNKTVIVIILTISIKLNSIYDTLYCQHVPLDILLPFSVFAFYSSIGCWRQPLYGLAGLYQHYEGGMGGRCCSASEPAAEVVPALNWCLYKRSELKRWNDRTALWLLV